MRVLAFSATGEALFLHDDSLIDLGVRLSGARAVPVRASNVEPDKDGFWWAEMIGTDAPFLGPYPTRQLALDAEAERVAEYLQTVAR